MKIEIVSATTHLDAHNERISHEGLEDIAASINEGHKPVFTVAHDLTIPPLGKVLASRVEKRDDGEFQLVEEIEIFENEKWHILVNGLRIFRQESANNNVPFVDRYYESSATEYEIAFDPRNFQSFDAGQDFVNELRSLSELGFHDSQLVRKALFPDPELIIKLAQAILPYLLPVYTAKIITDKIIEKVGDDVADDFLKFYTFVKITLVTYAKYVTPNGRPTTYIFAVPGDPTIEFVIRTVDPNVALSAIAQEKLQHALSQAKELEQILGATKLQFMLNDEEDWEFNYMLTKTGGVIGTEKAFSNRARKFELLMNKNNPLPSENSE